MNRWDKRWMEMVELVSRWSKDRSRQVGAVIVDSRNVCISMGWNGFPRGIDDEVEERHDRPVKYLWTEHAERNAIYNAAAAGSKLLGCRIYLGWYPCADCARAIIQSGIGVMICVEPDWGDKTYAADFKVVEEMLREASVEVIYAEGLVSPVRVGNVKTLAINLNNSQKTEWWK